MGWATVFLIGMIWGWLSISFVDEEFAVVVEEEEWVLVAFLHDPAAAVFLVDLHDAVAVADFLLGEEVVVAVEDLQVGVAIGEGEGIHVVVAHDVGYEVGVVIFADIFADHDDVADTMVMPVAMAVAPEARPIVDVERYGVPEDGVHVDAGVVDGVIEVGRRTHGSMGRRHGTGTACTGIGGSTCRARYVAGAGATDMVATIFGKGRGTRMGSGTCDGGMRRTRGGGTVAFVAVRAGAAGIGGTR